PSMDGHLQRARTLLQHLIGRQPASEPTNPPAAELLGNNLAVVANHVTFVDLAKAAAEPATWFEAFIAAAMRNLPIDPEALAVIESHATDGAVASLMRIDGARQVIELLRPRPGLSQRLAEMRGCGLLGHLFPDIPALGAEMRAAHNKSSG